MRSPALTLQSPRTTGERSGVSMEGASMQLHFQSVGIPALRVEVEGGYDNDSHRLSITEWQPGGWISTLETGSMPLTAFWQVWNAVHALCASLQSAFKPGDSHVHGSRPGHRLNILRECVFELGRDPEMDRVLAGVALSGGIPLGRNAFLVFADAETPQVVGWRFVNAPPSGPKPSKLASLIAAYGDFCSLKDMMFITDLYVEREGHLSMRRLEQTFIDGWDFMASTRHHTALKQLLLQGYVLYLSQAREIAQVAGVTSPDIEDILLAAFNRQDRAARLFLMSIPVTDTYDLFQFIEDRALLGRLLVEQNWHGAGVLMRLTSEGTEAGHSGGMRK